MPAKFMVERTYLLPSRSLFVFEGDVIDGEVRAGMTILINFNRSFSMGCIIESVEFVRSASGERVALTVCYADAGESEFLESFKLNREEVVVADPEKESEIDG